MFDQISNSKGKASECWPSNSWKVFGRCQSTIRQEKSEKEIISRKPLFMCGQTV